jgi:hypothetical protein
VRYVLGLQVSERTDEAMRVLNVGMTWTVLKKKGAGCERVAIYACFLPCTRALMYLMPLPCRNVLSYVHHLCEQI